ARLLVMGFTFKENCPDTRNTQVAALVHELAEIAAEVVVSDPRADADEARHEYGIEISSTLPAGPFEAAVLAVRHDEIVALGQQRIRALLAPGGLVYDIKGVLPRGESDAGL
ncbi:MAG: UDP binding domain-containing protein, partial [Hyphomicrobiaceae bacterium]